MLSKKTIDLIAKLTKTKPSDIESAIKDEKEVEMAIDEKLSVFSDDEIIQLKANEYKRGKEVGPEMAVKEVKEKLGLDFQGKTIEGLVEAAQKKALTDAKIEPDKKVAELETKLKNAQTTAAELQTKLTEKEAEISSSKTQGLIIRDMPNGTMLPAEKVLLLMKADGYDYKNENGKIIWSKNGEILSDKLGNNLPTKAIAESYISENKLAKEEGAGASGRGGGDKGSSGKAGKLSELKSRFEAEKKSVLGQEFQDAVAAAVKENPEFEMNG